MPDSSPYDSASEYEKQENLEIALQVVLYDVKKAWRNDATLQVPEQTQQVVREHVNATIATAIVTAANELIQEGPVVPAFNRLANKLDQVMFRQFVLKRKRPPADGL